MINTNVNNITILEEEPSLQDYIRRDAVNYDAMVVKSYSEMLMDLRNRNYDLRRLATPLTVYASGSFVGVSSGTVSTKDNINRSILKLTVTSIPSTEVFKLEGGDDTTGTFIQIGDLITVAADGTYYIPLVDYYYYYKLTKVTATTSTVEAVLFESVYHYLHLYRALYNIYKSLVKTSDDIWMIKAEKYLNDYNYLLDSSSFSYDVDDDKIIDTDDNYGSKQISLTM